MIIDLEDFEPKPDDAGFENLAKLARVRDEITSLLAAQGRLLGAGLIPKPLPIRLCMHNGDVRILASASLSYANGGLILLDQQSRQIRLTDLLDADLLAFRKIERAAAAKYRAAKAALELGEKE